MKSLYQPLASANEIFDTLGEGFRVQYRRRSGGKYWCFLSRRQDRIIDINVNEYRTKRGVWANRYRDANGVLFYSGFYTTPEQADFYVNPRWTRVRKVWLSFLP